MQASGGLVWQAESLIRQDSALGRDGNGVTSSAVAVCVNNRPLFGGNGVTTGWSLELARAGRLAAFAPRRGRRDSARRTWRSRPSKTVAVRWQRRYHPDVERSRLRQCVVLVGASSQNWRPSSMVGSLTSKPCRVRLAAVFDCRSVGPPGCHTDADGLVGKLECRRMPHCG